MPYGIVTYDKEGKPICEICGQSFDRLLRHTQQKHGVTAKEYKKRFGLDAKKGICSKDSEALARQRVMENYNTVVADNLLKNGVNSRFKKGDRGRTKEKVSEQTRIMLRNRFIGIHTKEEKIANLKKAKQKHLDKNHARPILPENLQKRWKQTDHLYSDSQFGKTFVYSYFDEFLALVFNYDDDSFAFLEKHTEDDVIPLEVHNMGDLIREMKILDGRLKI